MKLSKNQVILEYKKGVRDIKEESMFGGALSVSSQKNSLVPLVVYTNFMISDTSVVPKGSIAFVKESLLSTDSWATSPFSIEGSDEKVVIADISSIVFFEVKEQ